MRTIITEAVAYKFEELSEEAQETALNNCRDWNVENSDWFEFVYEQQTETIKNAGFDLTEIYFSGFWSQGDGAMFEYQIHSDSILHKQFVDSLKLSPLRSSILLSLTCVQGTGQHRGHYYHENSCSHNVVLESDYSSNYNLNNLDGYIDSLQPLFEDFIEDLYRNLAQDLYSALNKEYDYLTSDEAVKETIECNEYEFDENGNLI